MKTVVALLALVHAAHCYGPKLVDELGVQILPGYVASPTCNGNFVKFNGLIDLKEGSLWHPPKDCKVATECYHIYTLKDMGNEQNEIIEEFQTIVNLYYGNVLIDKLKVGSIATSGKAQIPHREVEWVKPVVTLFNIDGYPDVIKVYYSMTQPKDIPCHYQLYERTSDSTSYNIKYNAKGNLVEVKDEGVCKDYLKVAVSRFFGHKLVEELDFKTWPNYKVHKLSTEGKKFQGKFDLMNPPKKVSLVPQYYVYKDPSTRRFLRKIYQTKVNLYYGEELVDQLRVCSIETSSDAVISDGLMHCVTPVVKSVDKEGRPTLIKVYYSMARPIDECPCHYQLYERTSVSYNGRPYKPKGDLVKVYSDVECDMYLQRWAIFDN